MVHFHPHVEAEIPTKNRRRRGWLTGLAIVLGSFVVGCGSSTPEGQVPVFRASGSVTFEGEPLEGATIVFTPQSPPSESSGKRCPISGARSDINGDFQVTTYKYGDGIPEGRYKITVSCEDLEKPRLDAKGKPVRGEYLELLPNKYQDANLSGFEIEIVPGENTLEDLALTR